LTGFLYLMYFKNSVQNRTIHLYMKVPWAEWIIVLMAHAYLHESQQYTVCHPSLVKIQIIWVVLVFYVYKMSSNQRAVLFLTSHTARGVLVKAKTHKNKMGFNETRCDRQKNKSYNFKLQRNKTRYQVKNKNKFSFSRRRLKLKTKKQNNSKFFFPFPQDLFLS
jgi:hypothetical protein